MQSKTGYVRKIESLGMLDGPGVRTVVFLSGCPLRCSYCHNPDMWKAKASDKITVTELISKLERFKPYYGKKGGVTFCGGEPLSQPQFLIEALKASRNAGINVALDTSGFGDKQYFDEILSLVDLVIFDLKDTDSDSYLDLTSKDIDTSNYFLEKVVEHQVKLWIRTVIIPGINDNKLFIDKLAAKINTLSNVERVELLPYHTLGVSKYQELGYSYRLEGIDAMDKKKLKELQKYLDQQLQLN